MKPIDKALLRLRCCCCFIC